MKITEEVKLTHHEYGPASHHNREYSISDKSIDELIAKLGEKGIIVDSNASEKKISYYSTRKNEHQEATVPLGTTFPGNVKHTLAYFLQGTGTGDSRHVKYELELKDYSSTGSSGNRIGGSVSGEYGVICNLTVEGNKIDASVVDSVNKAIHETYIPPVVLSEEEKEQLRKFEEQIADELKRQEKG